jgi:hypothetical protein
LEGHQYITQIIFYCQALFATTVALRLSDFQRTMQHLRRFPKGGTSGSVKDQLEWTLRGT